MINHSETVGARGVWEIASRHKRKIVLFPLLAVLAGVLFYVCCPRTYRSEARLFLRVGRESVGVDPTATTGQTMPLYTSDRKDEVKSAEGIFKSRSIAAEVVDQLGPDVILGRSGDGAKQPNIVTTVLGMPLRFAFQMINRLDPISDREAAIIKVERSLSVTAERQATVIILQYSAATPQLAQKVCEAIVDVARKEHMRIHRNEESRLFFTEQQDRLREQLEKSLEALRDAKNQMGLASVEQRRATLESEYSAIVLDRLATNQQLATAQASIDNLQRQLDELPERVVASKRSVPNDGADLLRDRLYELQVKSMDLEARYNKSHPLVKAVNDQLAEAKKVVAEQDALRMETTDDINSIHRDLTLAMKQEQSVAAGLTARLKELDQQHTTILAELRAVNQYDLQIDQLTRESELARSKYLQYARNMEEARIDKELENQSISNIGVVQAATLTEKPVVPSRLLVALGTFLLATVGTFVLVRSSEQSHAAAISGAVNNSDGRMQRRRIRRRARLPETGALSNGGERLLPR
jgi:uncharacterized protein involved in exopolysaccharide biosynthesis